MRKVLEVRILMIFTLPLQQQQMADLGANILFVEAAKGCR
jgi:hypothetical protein